LPRIVAKTPATSRGAGLHFSTYRSLADVWLRCFLSILAALRRHFMAWSFNIRHFLFDILRHLRAEDAADQSPQERQLV
jgi:hypothetical protein